MIECAFLVTHAKSLQSIVSLLAHEALDETRLNPFDATIGFPVVGACLLEFLLHISKLSIEFEVELFS